MTELNRLDEVVLQCRAVTQELKRLFVETGYPADQMGLEFIQELAEWGVLNERALNYIVAFLIFTDQMMDGEEIQQNEIDLQLRVARVMVYILKRKTMKPVAQPASRKTVGSTDRRGLSLVPSRA